MLSRRKFLQALGLSGAGAVASTAVAKEYVTEPAPVPKAEPEVVYRDRIVYRDRDLEEVAVTAMCPVGRWDTYFSVQSPTGTDLEDA